VKSNRPLVSVFLLTWATVAASPGFAAGWAAFDVPADREQASVSLLEGRGVTTLAWSNALVEVSAFDAVELRPVAALEVSLTAWDPRWDPWLKSLKPVFRPRQEVSRLWVEGASEAKAASLLGAGTSGKAGEAAGPRQVTGWLIVFAAVLFLIFRGLVALANDQRPFWRRWLWLPLTLAVGAGGFSLTQTSERRSSAAAENGASWLRHLWFQQAFAYGAQWEDWKAGTGWMYRAYQRRDGRLVEVPNTLTVPDAAWAQKAYASLDPHAAARLFPPEKP
jgi:hypothetical protein